MPRTSSRRPTSTLAGDLEPTCADPKLPPLLWLRLHVGRRLTTLHRQHLGTRMRDAGLEISLYREALPEASSAALASMLLGRHTSPTQAAQRAERLLRVQEALNTLDPIDREVLALRHFEQLSRAETAEVLGISQEAAAKRYFRALKRLKDVLASMPGGLGGDLSHVHEHAVPPITGCSTSWPRSSPRGIRRGERPSLQEYIDRCPELADEIRELFPALVEVEQAEEDQPARPAPERRSPLPPPAPGGRLPDPPRGRPGRHGRGLRGRAGLARPPRGAEGPARQVSQDRKTLERFRREARSAAQLHHTNIVPVFEVGKDGEVSYYAMQFIQGQGLDVVIDELAHQRQNSGHGSAAHVAAEEQRPGRPGTTQAREDASTYPAGPASLPVRDRTEALAASLRAHQVSRMARSLVTGTFAAEIVEPARTGSASGLTATGCRIPGPAARRACQTEEPVRPRTVDSRIPRDLETIVLKSIDKDPDRRYPTADAMAEDLRRYLDDEPVLARRTTALEQMPGGRGTIRESPSSGRC